MNRTFPHFQSGIPGWARSWYEQTRAGWGKVMDPGESPPLPECPWVKWIVRFYLPDELVYSDVMRGVEGAWIHYERIKSDLRKRPWLRDSRFYVEHHNEPSNAGCLDTLIGQKATAEYGATLTRILWNEEHIRSGAGCLGVGHPEPEDAVRICAAPMAELMEAEGLYVFHEYGWPVMDSGQGYWTLRYRRTLQALRNAGATQFPGIVITETGIDGRLVQRDEGWQWVNDDPRWYAGQLQWYDSELTKDGILGAFVFTASPNEPWKSQGYEVTEALAAEMAKRWTAQPEPPPEPPEPPEPPAPEPEGDLKIYDKEGKEQDTDWLETNFGPVKVAAASDGPAWRVTELREAEGYAAILVRARPGVQVARWWPDSGLPQLPAELATWKPQGVYATVKPEGHCDFGMGFGDYYFPPSTGASWYWCEGPSDCCQGWGMLGGTNHRHLDITFEWVEDEEPPPPPPPPPPNDEARAKIEQARGLLVEAMILLGDALELLG